MEQAGNRFAGSWSGKWVGRTYKGSWKILISENGQVAGETDTSGNHLLGKLNGHITDSGELSYSYSYKADRTGKGNASFTAPDEILVNWRDFDDGFLYEQGVSHMKRLEPG